MIDRGIMHDILRFMNSDHTNDTEEAIRNSEEYEEEKEAYEVDELVLSDCPICGHKTLGLGDICRFCGWEDDFIYWGDHPDLINYTDDDDLSLANGYSLSEYREAYRILSTAKSIFVGGSKSIDTLTDDEKTILQEYMDNDCHILIGDCSGADRAIQEFLASADYPFVTVYATGSKVRNNVGKWHCRKLQAQRKKHDFEYYRVKDRAMVEDAHEIFMLWDGKSRGTYANMSDGLNASKPVRVSTKAGGILPVSSKEALEKIREC